MSSISNRPDPTPHEVHDEVADARHDIMEWLGNCEPVYEIGNLLAQVSPLALGIFVTSCLIGLEKDSFTGLEIATARGEVAHTPRARRVMEGVLAENEAVAAMGAHLMPDIPAADRGARAVLLLGQDVDNNTAPYRDHMEKNIQRRWMERVDWHKLSEDMHDDPPTWHGYDPDHDPRGCHDCAARHCLVGLEDA